MRSASSRQMYLRGKVSKNSAHIHFSMRSASSRQMYLRGKVSKNSAHIHFSMQPASSKQTCLQARMTCSTQAYDLAGAGHSMQQRHLQKQCEFFLPYVTSHMQAYELAGAGCGLQHWSAAVLLQKSVDIYIPS
eukprot:1161222-Pelagomonas_calceolata.AAC.10